jgi:hypothetical protein
MKKNLFKLLTLLLALCLVLCACGDTGRARDDDDEEEEDTKASSVLATTAAVEDPTEAPTIETAPAPTGESDASLVGTWKLEMECGGLYNMILGLALGGELPESVDFTGLKLTVYYTFNADGTYELTMKDADLELFAQEASDKIMTCMYDLMEVTLASELDGKTLDEFLKEQGMTFEQLLEASGVDADMLSQSMLESMDISNTTGEYALEDGMLILADSKQPYSLDGDTLTIYAPEIPENEMFTAVLDSLYPMVLTRVN